MSGHLEGKNIAITGAGSGIGKAIAFELVRKGMHVLLISRSAAKLQAVKSELVSEHKEAMVETLEVDFSALSADVYSSLVLVLSLWFV